MAVAGVSEGGDSGQARYDNWGGGGELLSASDPIRKVGALKLFGIGPVLFKYVIVITGYNFGRGG